MNRVIIYCFLVLLAWLYSCQRGKEHPGYVYYPDMTNSQAYETFSENPILGDSATMKTTVPGSVSRERIPYLFDKGKAGRLEAGKYYDNPLFPGDQNLAEGKALYFLLCNQCHGEKGDGRGYLFTEELYPYQPANLLEAKTVHVPDGELFHVATVGFNLMGAHGSMLTPDERWKVVLYVRKLQNKTTE